MLFIFLRLVLEQLESTSLDLESTSTSKDVDSNPKEVAETMIKTDFFIDPIISYTTTDQIPASFIVLPVQQLKTQIQYISIHFYYARYG